LPQQALHHVEGPWMQLVDLLEVGLVQLVPVEGLIGHADSLLRAGGIRPRLFGRPRWRRPEWDRFTGGASGPHRRTQDLFECLGVALDQLPLILPIDDPARLLVVASLVVDVVAELLTGEHTLAHAYRHDAICDDRAQCL